MVLLDARKRPGMEGCCRSWGTGICAGDFNGIGSFEICGWTFGADGKTDGEPVTFVVVVDITLGGSE